MVKYRLYKIVDKGSLEKGEIPGEFLEQSIYLFCDSISFNKYINNSEQPLKVKGLHTVFSVQCWIAK